MKRILLFAFVIALVIPTVAQPTLDLGLKGGVNFSKISFDSKDYTSESVVKSHIGAFGRIGWDRVFIQPELYFSGKGGDVTSDPASTMTSFDYTTFDIPLLLGVKVIKGKVLDVHLVGGPVFSSVTKDEISNGEIFDESYYRKSYMGVQYGVGVDVLFLTLDARIENGLSNFYSQNNNGAANNTFMVSVGIKIL